MGADFDPLMLNAGGAEEVFVFRAGGDLYVSGPSTAPVR